MSESVKVSRTLEAELKWLSDAWRMKGLEIASRYHGQVGDAVKALLETCASELEDELRRIDNSKVERTED